VVLGSAWNGRVQVLIDGGSPIGIEWNQAIQEADGYAIVNGAPNLENAYKLIDYAMQPKVLAKLAEYTGYAPLSKTAYQYIPANVVAVLPTTPERSQLAVVRDAVRWDANLDQITQGWDNFLVS
jgi:putative spermidine/putrescine transport system substrate-binding protein